MSTIKDQLPREVYLETTKFLYPTLHRDKALKSIVRTLVESIESADAGIIYLYNRNSRCLTAVACYGYRWDRMPLSIHPKEGAPGQCCALRKALLYTSPEDIKKSMETLAPDNLKYYLRIREGLMPILSMVVIPFQLWGKTLPGVLQLEQYREHRPFIKKDINNLEEICSWIALMIDNIEVHAELKQRKHSYREMLGKFIRSSEEERKKIAREIHDEVNQLLLCIKIDLENIENILPTECYEIKNRLENSKSYINQVLNELHDLSLSLRPPALDDLGLPQALDWYVNNRLSETCLPIMLEVTGERHRRPAPIVETELFRIAQEALSNAIKHSHATFVKVRLHFNEVRLVLSVEDNGRGFASERILNIYSNKKNLGLLGMTERAKILGGNLSINTAPGRGTQIKVEIPIFSHDWGVY